MKRPVLATLVALAVAIPATAGAATAPTISITSPAAGTTYSRALVETIPVTGTATFGEPVPATRTFYVRRDDCGGAADNPHLSVQQSTDGGDGCGYIWPQPVVDPPGTDFPATDGVPFTLDATKPVTATVKASSFQGVVGSPGFGVGQVTMTVTLSATVGNQGKILGSASSTYMVTPGTAEYTKQFEIPLAAADNGKKVSDLSLNVRFSGPAVLCDFIAASGASFVNMPIIDNGVVEVSSDSATFAASKTVQATLNTDGTWNAQIVVPSAGFNRKIYARAVQGGVTTNAAPVTISVTA